MFDETNITEEQELELPEKLFESDEDQNEESFNENHIEEAGNTLKIKYNGQERDITLDEARILAQKGMNYDHVVAERDTKYKRELDFLDRVAGEQGLSRAQYIAMQEEASKARTKSQESYTNPRERAAAQLRRITDSVGMTGPWGSLFRKYPNLTRKEAYPLLSESVANGMTPIEAYQEKLLSEKDRQLRIARESENASRKSVGSLEGDGGGTSRDEFLEGFFMYD